ncbi:TonB family protein [Pseudoalteromonas ruthenica]|uniref:TonB family protein n=1 Tax=Pseudoalteromonas ruthenica TaxID=151081 RepID=UPI00110BC17B|nr:TonB family protein [Pseudoalteromonas ruthenica]TMO44298.1 energy transducer TonB [Pseudoalteromonas ruthenica]TMO51495.1 energy transducer TonB [Pseudoalteromonas ruthenica]
MFAWIIAQQAWLSALLITLVIVERYALKSLTARFIYGLWLVVPAALIAQHVELSQSVASPTVLNSYIVTPLQQASTQVSMNWEIAYWLVVTVLLLGVFLQHAQFQRRIGAKLTSTANVSNASLPIYESTKISSPMLIGFLRPRIVLPSYLVTQHNPDTLALMIEHEHVHLRRHDNIINAAALGCVILMWFNPLTWLGYFSLRRTQELACDELVLANKSATQRLLYGKSMVECASRSQLHSLAYSYYGDKNMMLQRLHNMQSANRGHIVAKVLSILLAFASITLIATTQAGEGHNQDKTDQPQAVMRIEPKYPIEAAEQNISGSVVLRFQIAQDGSVNNVTVVKSQPAQVFDKEAVRALEQWQYQPYSDPEHEHLVQLDFKLSNDVQLPDLTERINVTSH